MEFNNNYGNNRGQQQKQYSPNVYTPYRMSNIDSSIDSTSLSFTFWNNLLTVAISPKKETGNSGEVAFDHENAAKIYINHTKARIFAEEIKRFLEDPATYTGSGISSGSGLITISNGAEFGVDCPLLVIRKLDDGGNVVGTYVYQFKTDYHFSVRNFTAADNFKTIKEDYQFIEIWQLVTLLEEYYKAMTNAVAYSVIDQMKFNQGRTDNKLNAIAEKLGVELPGGRKSFSSSSSFFNSAANNSAGNNSINYPQATLDDLED